MTKSKQKVFRADEHIHKMAVKKAKKKDMSIKGFIASLVKAAK